MRKISALCLAMMTFVLLATMFSLAVADGSGSAGSGSSVVVVTVTASDKLHDITLNPAAAIDDIAQAKRQGWVLLVLTIVTIGARGLGKLGKSNPKLAFLGQGKVALAFGITAAIAAACVNAATDSGSWGALLSAALFGGAAWWNAHATDKNA